VSEPAQLTLDFATAVRPERDLPRRLRALGLSPGMPVALTRNRSILVSWTVRGGLRLHAGYAWAPDDVLLAIVHYLRPRMPRAERRTLSRRFTSFPAWQHAPTRPSRRAGPRPVAPGHQELIDRLERAHAQLNRAHFGGALPPIPLRLSDRMRTRLGEFRADLDGRAVEITISRRHLRRDGWRAAEATLLHEMIHQWQCVSGLPLDHRAAFRRKARELGISPRAVVD
jgi:hypothetical protein